jgi:hypothetical protein
MNEGEIPIERIILPLGDYGILISNKIMTSAVMNKRKNLVI